MKNYFNRENIKQQFTQKSFRIGGYSALASIIVIAIAVFVIITVESMSSKNTKIDMTNASLYSLSEESVNIAKAVDKEVTLYLLAPNGSEDNIIYNMLDKYTGYNKNIKLEIKDPIVFPNFAQNYTSEQIELNSVIVTSGEKSRYVAYSEIYKTNVDYSSYTQTTEYDGENQITSAIDFVVSDELPKLYMLTGHGELPLSENVSADISAQNMEIEDISLLTMSQAPEDADCILMNSPQSDISPNEKDVLLSYLQNGGKLMLITGYNGVEMPVLNELMKNYGVMGENTLVFEGDENKCISGYNHYLLPDMTSHDITKPLIESRYYALLPLSHPIIKTGESSVTVTSLISTSNKAYAKPDALNMTTMEKEDTDSNGPFDIGVSVTDSENDTKIVWISSSQLVDDNMNQMVSGGNQDLFLNSLNWMLEREESIAIHAKSLASDTITISAKAVSILSFTFIFLIPALFIICGIYIKIKRKKN